MTIEVRRPRDDAELERANLVGRRAFGVQHDPTRFLAGCLASVHRRRAEPWILTDGGSIVASLRAFPLAFRTPAGEDVDGVGLASVATLPEARGRGHAEALCRHVVEDADAAGRPLGLLFSAVGTRLYGRLGFREAAGWSHTAADVAGLAYEAPPGGLAVPDWRPLDPFARRAELVARYDAAHAGKLHLRRDAAAWETSLRLHTDHLWLGLDHGAAGYARLSLPKDEAADAMLYLDELCLADPAQEAAALIGLARVAQRWGRGALKSWLAPVPGLEGWLDDGGREQTLPMVRGDADPAALRVWPPDYF